MDCVVESALIVKFWEALALPRRPLGRTRAADVLRDIAHAGWAHRYDLDDILYGADPRLDRRTMVGPLSQVMGLTWRPAFFRPKAGVKEAIGDEALAASDIAYLLISLKDLGFAIDPAPLVHALRPSVQRMRRLTLGDIAVLWYTPVHDKVFTQCLRLANMPESAQAVEHFSTDEGYAAELWRDESGEAVQLKVHTPHVASDPVAA